MGDIASRKEEMRSQTHTLPGTDTRIPTIGDLLEYILPHRVMAPARPGMPVPGTDRKLDLMGAIDAASNVVPEKALAGAAIKGAKDAGFLLPIIIKKIKRDIPDIADNAAMDLARQVLAHEGRKVSTPDEMAHAIEYARAGRESTTGAQSGRVGMQDIQEGGGLEGHVSDVQDLMKAAQQHGVRHALPDRVSEDVMMDNIVEMLKSGEISSVQPMSKGEVRAALPNERNLDIRRSLVPTEGYQESARTGAERSARSQANTPRARASTTENPLPDDTILRPRGEPHRQQPRPPGEVAGTVAGTAQRMMQEDIPHSVRPILEPIQHEPDFMDSAHAYIVGDRSAAETINVMVFDGMPRRQATRLIRDIDRAQRAPRRGSREEPARASTSGIAEDAAAGDENARNHIRSILADPEVRALSNRDAQMLTESERREAGTRDPDNPNMVRVPGTNHWVDHRNLPQLTVEGEAQRQGRNREGRIDLLHRELRAYAFGVPERERQLNNADLGLALREATPGDVIEAMRRHNDSAAGRAHPISVDQVTALSGLGDAARGDIVQGRARIDAPHRQRPQPRMDMIEVIDAGNVTNRHIALLNQYQPQQAHDLVQNALGSGAFDSLGDTIRALPNNSPGRINLERAWNDAAANEREYLTEHSQPRRGSTRGSREEPE
jgi:hypothetical protein